MPVESQKPISQSLKTYTRRQGKGKWHLLTGYPDS